MAQFKPGDWVCVEHHDRLYQVKHHDKSLRRVYLFSDYASFWCYELDVTLAIPQEIAHFFAEEICNGEI